MAETFKTARPGMPLELSAEWKNLGNEVFRDYLQNRNGGGQPPVGGLPVPPTIIQIRNNSGIDVPRFGVLGVGTPLFNPTDSLDEFKRVRAFSGVLPTITDHKARFAILREPLAAGKIGTAWVMGVCQVKIDVTVEAHRLADVKNIDSSQLQSSTTGSALILYKEAGTGSKWALVRFGGEATVVDIRWNDTTKKIQATYVSNPTEDDWVDKITFYPCIAP